jgi:transcriptional regulator with XRE-family HTH domain
MRINGAALRTIRTDRGVPLGALASRVGLKQHSHLSNIEAGRREASAKLIRALARELQVDVLSLLGPEEPTRAVREALGIPDDADPKIAATTVAKALVA